MTGKPTNIRWRLFGILAFGSFASYMLRSNVSMAAPAMMQDLGLTEIQFGWILASFTAGYAAFQFPGGVFGDHAHHYRSGDDVARILPGFTRGEYPDGGSAGD